MACKLPVALIQTCDPSRFDHNFFLTSYFTASKWWPITEWNKSHFFPLVNFGQSCYFQVLRWRFSIFTALHKCDVSHHVTWMGPFSKWPSIERQKKFVENLILHYISFICSFRILKPNRNVLGQKKGKIWRQLPFKIEKKGLRRTKSGKFTLSIAVHTSGLAKYHFWLVVTQKRELENN